VTLREALIAGVISDQRIPAIPGAASVPSQQLPAKPTLTPPASDAPERHNRTTTSSAHRHALNGI
jgi:hypothetical protein